VMGMLKAIVRWVIKNRKAFWGLGLYD